LSNGDSAVTNFSILVLGYKAVTEMSAQFPWWIKISSLYLL